MWHKSDAADTQLCTDIIHRGKLHALCIGIDPTTADHYLGTKPTATHTGVLSPWVIRYLELHPHLTRLVTEERTPLPHWYEVSDYSNDYHCTSHVGDSPGQVFYHLRADPFIVLPGLLADPDTVPYPLRRDTSSELHPRPGSEIGGWRSLGRKMPRNMGTSRDECKYAELRRAHIGSRPRPPRLLGALC